MENLKTHKKLEKYIDNVLNLIIENEKLKNKNTQKSQNEINKINSQLKKQINAQNQLINQEITQTKVNNLNKQLNDQLKAQNQLINQEIIQTKVNNLNKNQLINKVTQTNVNYLNKNQKINQEITQTSNLENRIEKKISNFFNVKKEEFIRELEKITEEKKKEFQKTNKNTELEEEIKNFDKLNLDIKENNVDVDYLLNELKHRVNKINQNLVCNKSKKKPKIIFLVRKRKFPNLFLE